MEKEFTNEAPGEQSQASSDGEKKIKFGPLIGSEGEVSGYDWDDQP